MFSKIVISPILPSARSPARRRLKIYTFLARKLVCCRKCVSLIPFVWGQITLFSTSFQIAVAFFQTSFIIFAVIFSMSFCSGFTVHKVVAHNFVECGLGAVNVPGIGTSPAKKAVFAGNVLKNGTSSALDGARVLQAWSVEP